MLYWLVPSVSRTTLTRYFLSRCSGLEDQLLALVVAEERPDLEEAKNQLIVSNAKMRQELKEIEDKILHKLSASEGSPVDDIDLIQTLEQSKAKSMEIKVTTVNTIKGVEPLGKAQSRGCRHNGLFSQGTRCEEKSICQKWPSPSYIGHVAVV